MENNKEDEFKVPQIKTRKDLVKVFDAIYDQGFGFIGNQDSYHKNKIDKIINKNNTLKLNVPDSFRKTLYDTTDYTEAEKIAINNFSKFNPNDKINEIINDNLSLISDDISKPPDINGDSINDVLLWVKFRNKYDLNDKDFKDNKVAYGTRVSIYNLDKKTIKINFRDSYDKFEELYKLIFNEKCIEIKKSAGDWQNIGKIEIKIFLNNTATIKGDLTEIKEYYYKNLKNKKQHYSSSVIYYNNNKEIIKMQF